MRHTGRHFQHLLMRRINNISATTTRTKVLLSCYYDYDLNILIKAESSSSLSPYFSKTSSHKILQIFISSARMPNNSAFESWDCQIIVHIVCIGLQLMQRQSWWTLNNNSPKSFPCTNSTLTSLHHYSF